MGYSGIIFDGDGGQGKGHVYCDGIEVAGFGAECNWFNGAEFRVDGVLLKELPYPIGCIYITESDSPNPNEILGFGKWDYFIKSPAFFWRRLA